MTYHLTGWIQIRISLSIIGSDDGTIANIDANGEDNNEEEGRGERREAKIGRRRQQWKQ